MLTKKPKQGDNIEYRDNAGFLVRTITAHHTRDGICYSQADESKDKHCFIYQFADGRYNNLHTIIGE